LGAEHVADDLVAVALVDLPEVDAAVDEGSVVLLKGEASEAAPRGSPAFACMPPSRAGKA
jgi:hypothetical protein